MVQLPSGCAAQETMSAQKVILIYVLMEKPQKMVSSWTLYFKVSYYIAWKSMIPFSIAIPGAHLKYHVKVWKYWHLEQDMCSFGGVRRWFYIICPGTYQGHFHMLNLLCSDVLGFRICRPVCLRVCLCVAVPMYSFLSSFFHLTTVDLVPTGRVRNLK